MANLADQTNTSATPVANTADTYSTPVPEVPVSEIDTAPAPVANTADTYSTPVSEVSGNSIDRQATPVPNYVAQYDNTQGTWEVVDSNTGTQVGSGLTEQEALLLAQEQDFIDSPIPVPQAQVAGQDPYPNPNGTAYDPDTGLLNPGWSLRENGDPVYIGGDFVEPATLASAEASRTSAAADRARKQQILIDQQRNLNKSDWRVRLSLADNSNYLYSATDPGILQWLVPTNGVLFPYTPQITTNYRANYSNYDLTHSNYRGYYYQNSYTDTVSITGAFTAQNTQEANYLLAVIHFFRSVTKMFYGQSQNLGSPPPICYLNGLGEFQFNQHPVLVTNFAYTLPSDVDYIRAGSSNNLQLNQNPLRPKSNTLNPQLASVARLANALIKPPQPDRLPPKLPNTNNPTYVPTKMEINITLLPVQSRTQVSQQFSMQNFANGNLLRGGFW